MVKNPSLFDVYLQKIIICFYAFCVNISKIFEKSKRLWKNINKKEKKKVPFFWVGLPPLPLTKNIKVILLVLFLMGCFLYGWNYVMVKHSWKDITRYTQIPFLVNEETREVLERREAIRDMFKDNIMQTVMVLGDYTPISYLAISSLLKNTISSNGNAYDSTNKKKDNIKPYVFIGSSLRIYQENNESFHKHYGLSLGKHSSGSNVEDILYEWIHSLISSTIWTNADFNLTETIKKYRNDPASVKPMIFVDFDVLSALCLDSVKEAMQLSPGTKLFGVVTPKDNDRVNFLLNNIYYQSRCVHMKNSSFLFGGNECFGDTNVPTEEITKENEVNNICVMENENDNPNEIYQKCCTLEKCYYASTEQYFEKDNCEWKKHSIALSRQKRLFHYLSKVFRPEDMFIMDLQSYLDNPRPLEREFAYFLSLPFGVNGNIEGSYDHRNPIICLKQIFNHMLNDKDESKNFNINKF